MRLFYLRESLRSSLWFLPAVFVVAAIVLALALTRADERMQAAGMTVGFAGGAGGARTFLSTVSSSMITFTGLVFSITIVVLQLASAQYTPRVLRSFLRDRHSQVALGVFVSTFTYSLMVLREIRSESPGDEFVPGLAITGAFVFVLLSLIVFVDYIHHIAQAIRVSSITRAIAEETRDAIADIYDLPSAETPATPPASPPSRVVACPRAGVITALNRDELVELAFENDCVLEVIPAIGDHVPQGAPLVKIFAKDGGPSDDAVMENIGIGPERTMQQDPPFGFRQLVDIAERSLSPAVNDPTTAVQALDEIHDLLRRIASRPFPNGQRADHRGELRLIYPVAEWDDYVSLACKEIRHYGTASIQVTRRMRAMLQDLMTVVPDGRKDPLEREMRLLDAGIRRSFPDEEERLAASEPDQQGVGS